MSSPSSSRASTRVSQNPDILPLILSHLPNSSLFHCLLTSSTFFHTAVAHLYRSLTIRHESDLFVGSTRSGASPSSSSIFEPLDHSSVSPAAGPSPYSKNHSLAYVREVHLFTHGKNQCPFVRHYINPLPNLRLLHLAGGEWPAGLDTADACASAECQFIAKACCTAPRVIVRSAAALGALGALPQLESVVLKLRPCQLPMYRFHEDKYAWPGRLPLGGAVALDLVFWDERHTFRIDWYEVPGPGVGRAGGVVGRLRAVPAGERQKIKLKGCTYCDEQGCVRHSPHAPVQLPALAYALGRETEVRRLRVWNAERTARKQWYFGEGAMGEHEVLLLMEQQFLEGRRERLAVQRVREAVAAAAGEVDDVMADVAVSFHSASEYYASPARWNGEMDAEEAEYWQMQAEPSPRLQELRQEARELADSDMAEDMFDVMGEEELARYVEYETAVQMTIQMEEVMQSLGQS